MKKRKEKLVGTLILLGIAAILIGVGSFGFYREASILSSREAAKGSGAATLSAFKFNASVPRLDIKIANIAEGSVIPRSKPLTILAEFSPGASPKFVKFFVDGKDRAIDYVPPFSYTLKQPLGPSGTLHTLEVQATDAHGVVGAADKVRIVLQ